MLTCTQLIIYQLKQTTMRKNYLLSILFSLLALITSNLYAQEMLMGGSMEIEDEEYWTVSLLNTDGDNFTEYEFGHLDDVPSYGENGCLYVYGTNTGEAGGNLTNIMFYQQVTLQKGVTYTFNAAYKDIRTNNYWFEVWAGPNEPMEGEDYGTDQGAFLISGVKSINWETNCPGDEFDGMLEWDACTPNTTGNLIQFEGEGDTTIFFGFRMGIWDDGGNGYEFQTFVDNVSLTGPETSVKNIASSAKVYPSPFADEINIELSQTIEEVEVLNILGQSIYRMTEIHTHAHRINTKELKDGIYFIHIKDAAGKTTVHKTIKR